MLLRFLASGLACRGGDVENARVDRRRLGERRALGETWWRRGVSRR